jgi:acetyl-CoA carboxylase carboxyltransferase component
MRKHDEKTLHDLTQEIARGGADKYHQANAEKGKLFVRDRLARLLDADSLAEDGMFANCMAGDLPADGVVCGVGRIHGRPVAVMANDSTVKAGSWGWRTVEKILRIQETAASLEIPMIYLDDSAGARITDQSQMFPGRRGAGRIFYNQVQMSGRVPQICLLFGPAAAGGAYIPAFCDVVFMVEGNASMYLGSPRMAEMVVGEKVSLEEMGGAKMHCSVSGCGDVLCKSEEEALDACKAYLGYFPQNYKGAAPAAEAVAPKSVKPIEEIVPADQNKLFNMNHLLDALVDAGSAFEIKKLFAKELITVLARIGGQTVGILANQPMVKGGVLFSDSADKAARFLWLCDAFNIPVIFLADVPGFMIGSTVERGGIIRHGAKMISAVSDITVPKISVIVRKAYGAGLYAMAGPAFEPDVCLALPGAMIAVMGPEAAINAVYANKIAELPEAEREAWVAQKREEYKEEIDIYRLSSELIVDHIIEGKHLREELIKRVRLYASKAKTPAPKRRSVLPV